MARPSKKRSARAASPDAPTRPERPRGKSGSGIDLRTLWSAVYRYPITTAITVALAAVAGVLTYVFVPLPRLTAYMTFQVSASPYTLMTPVGSDRSDFQMYRQRQSTAVRSRVVLNEALKKPEVANLPLLRERAEPLNWLENQVRVDFRMGPEFMRVTMEGDDEEQLTAILQAIGTAYLDDVRNKESSLKRKEKQLVEKTLAAYTEELANQLRDIRNFEESVGSAADPSVIAVKQKIADERLWMTQKQLFDIQSQIRRLDIDLKVAKARETASPAGASEPLIQLAIKADPEWQRLAALRKTIAEQIAAYQARAAAGTVPPRLKELEADLAAAQKDIDQAADRVRTDTIAAVKQQSTDADKTQAATVAQQLAVLREHEKVLIADAETQMKRVKALDGGQFDIAERRDKIAEKQKVAQQLSSRVEAIRVELDTPSRAELLEPPTTVPGIEGFRRMRYTALAVLGVLAVGLGVNVIREVRNPRVTGAACVESQLGLPVVGTIPRIPAWAASQRMVAGPMPDWQIALAEALNTTRLVMLGGAAGTPVRTLLVTSAMSGEGKSSVALQLAMSLAQAGNKTVVIDGDMRRPQLHTRLGMLAPPPTQGVVYDGETMELNTRLGLDGSPGLAEVLRGELPVERALADTAVPGLSLLAAGRWDPLASRAVGTGKWKKLLAELAATHDYVVIDSTPLLPVADGLAMARDVDGVVLSVLRDVSELQFVAEAQKRLAAVGANVLGVVLSGAGQVLYRYSPYSTLPTESPSVVPLALAGDSGSDPRVNA